MGMPHKQSYEPYLTTGKQDTRSGNHHKIMAEYIISPDSAKDSALAEDTAKDRVSLSVCELFVDAVQGEGAYSGASAAATSQKPSPSPPPSK